MSLSTRNKYLILLLYTATISILSYLLYDKYYFIPINYYYFMVGLYLIWLLSLKDKILRKLKYFALFALPVLTNVLISSTNTCYDEGCRNKIYSLCISWIILYFLYYRKSLVIKIISYFKRG